ncbi:MAG: hypothetical protein QUU85_04305 [Candidatus Eisenbacteria bacterium]|nr:hypothetical protein [Candidatus Eisenbacteria bacterium]
MPHDGPGRQEPAGPPPASGLQPGTIRYPLLLSTIERQFLLDLEGVHGRPHWKRVLENGIRLAPLTGAKQPVVELFALIHDARRVSDTEDRDHGLRAAAFALSLAGNAFQLEKEDLDLLLFACRDHSHGQLQADVTIQTCWDADRLDLGRIGIRPLPEMLCTEAARDPILLSWAFRRSRET